MKVVLRILYLGFIGLTCLYLSLPTIVVFISSFSASAVIRFPPDGFSFRWYANFAQRPEFISSVAISLAVALVVAVLSVMLSILTTREIGRNSSRRQRLVQAMSFVPLVLPTIILAPALLLMFASLGWTTSFQGTLVVLVAAHLIITLPYTFRVCQAAYLAMPPTYEEAAEAAGAGSAQTIWRVLLPGMGSALMAGGLFAFLVSFDEPVISLFLSRQDLVTLPVQIQTYVRFQPDPTIAAISTIMSLVALSVILVADRLIGLDKIFGLSR